MLFKVLLKSAYSREGLPFAVLLGADRMLWIHIVLQSQRVKEIPEIFVDFPLPKLTSRYKGPQGPLAFNDGKVVGLNLRCFGAIADAKGDGKMRSFAHYSVPFRSPPAAERSL